MAQIRIPFEKFELSEKDNKTEFIAESLFPGKYNGFNITPEDLTKAAPLWVGADVVLGHSDNIIGEITHSAIETGKLIQKGILDDLKAINLVKKGKLKPSIGASSGFEKRADGIYAIDIKPDHLALVRNPACKTCSIKINEKWLAMTEENQESFIKSIQFTLVMAFTAEQLIEMLSFMKDHPDMIDNSMKDLMKGMIKLEDETGIKLKLEDEIKTLKLKLGQTEKTLMGYKESEKLALAEKLFGTELKLGLTSQDKHTFRIEEIKKLELSDIKEKYVLSLEDLSQKIQKGQGKVELGEHSDPKSPSIGSYDPVKKEWV